MKTKLFLLSFVICAGCVIQAAPPPRRPDAPRAVVHYQPKRNVYTIQLNLRDAILFEQRSVGMRELRDKIRMVSNDRPRPLIIVRVAHGVAEKRVSHALSLLRQAGFNDVKIERLNRRVRPNVAPRKAAPRMKRPVR